MERVNTVNSDMNAANKILIESHREGMLTEVVFFALKAMKKDPSLSVLRAICIGCEEWDI
jgi:hypothetical protein